MKLRESGMPGEAYWESLLDAERILKTLGVDTHMGDVVELGCGYGTFSIPAARRISGRLHTFDIDPSMIARTQARAAELKLNNLDASLRDVFTHGFDVPDNSQDACLLFNILHCEEPARLLREAARVLKDGGTLLAIHWRYAADTPRGPSMEIRPTPESIARLIHATGHFDAPSLPIDLPPWHYGLSCKRCD